MSYKWSIEKVVVAENDVVKHVHCLCEFNGFSCAGIRNLIRSNSFTAYDQLTEQQVLDWCFEPETIILVDIDGNEQSITKILKDDSEAQVAGQIQRHLDRVKNEPALPWALSN